MTPTQSPDLDSMIAADECSPYLRNFIAKPCPAYVRGTKVWVPGEFGYRVVIDVRWHGNNWEYVFNTDLEDEAEILALQATRERIAA